MSGTPGSPITDSASLTQVFNGIIYPIVATVLFAVVQLQLKKRVDNRADAQHEAAWGDDWRGYLKAMCMFSSFFGFLNVFSPSFQTSLVAMAVPMVGYMGFHTSDAAYLLAYAVLMVPFATTGGIAGAATGWDKYAAVNPIVCDNYFHNDFGAGFCKKGWLNTLTVLGFLNYLAAFVTGFAALMHYVAARNNNGKVLP